jgi:hypothetical protein
VTIANPETRKRLIISRHIAKMSPKEVARRFNVNVMVKTVGLRKPRARTLEP